MQQSEKESLVGLICDRLSTDYVSVDVAEKMSEGIQEKLASGDYDSARDYQEFATLTDIN